MNSLDLWNILEKSSVEEILTYITMSVSYLMKNKGISLDTIMKLIKGGIKELEKRG